MRENIDLLKQFMDMLEKQFGPNCEVVLNDFTEGYDHTILDIRNGHITGRAVGGCATNLGLEIMSGTAESGSKFNYITYTKSGKILKSSSLHFCNENGELIGSLCVNLDITDSVKYENYLREFNCYNKTSEQSVKEFFVSDVQQLLDELIHQAFQITGKTAENMNREDKIKFIEYLEKKGAFIISKSGEKICDLLSISKYTFYNYLDLIRKDGSEGKEQSENAE